ncbi:MAG: inositol monophosphatase family protein [Acidimicrobiales bacterium]
MTSVTRELLDEVVALTRAAGDLTLRWFRQEELNIEHKGDGTPVTAADRAAERYLREQLASRFPDDAIIGEEEPDSKGSSGRTWIIDPIDGTKAFTHGVPLYSNLLALYDDLGAAIGVINLPALGETVYAARGIGCFFDGRPARVSDRSALDGGCVCTSGLGSWSSEQLAAVRSSGALLRTWGDGYGFALVATGRAEAMVDPRVAIWDVAPMPVILSEAGGRFTTTGGDEHLPVDATGVLSGVATNGHVHDEVLTLLAAHLSE